MMPLLRNWLIDFSYENDVHDEKVMLYTTQPNLSVKDALNISDSSYVDFSSDYFTTFPSSPDIPFLESTLEKPALLQETLTQLATHLSTDNSKLPSVTSEASTAAPSSVFSPTSSASLLSVGSPLSSATTLESDVATLSSPLPTPTTSPPSSRVVSSPSTTTITSGSGLSIISMSTSTSSSRRVLEADSEELSEPEIRKNFRTQEMVSTPFKEVKLDPLTTYLPKVPTTKIPSPKLSGKVTNKRKLKSGPQTQVGNFSTKTYSLPNIPSFTPKPSPAYNKSIHRDYGLAAKNSYQSIYEIISR